MQNSFGYLTSGQGYQGHVFPLVIGETGSMYLTVSSVPSLLLGWFNQITPARGIGYLIGKTGEVSAASLAMHSRLLYSEQKSSCLYQELF